MPRKKKRATTKKATTKKVAAPMMTANKCAAKMKWAFHISWILALILSLGGAFGGAWVTMPFWTLVLVILGLIVGFGYKTTEITPLILIAVALAIFGGSSLAVIPYVGGFISNVIAFFTSFLTPAALIVALRKIYEMLS